jgi:hypothetical protein
VRFSRRAATLSFCPVNVVVWAWNRSSIAAWTTASDGTGDGNHGFPVISATIDLARATSRGTSYSGSFRTTTIRRGGFAEVLIFSGARIPREWKWGAGSPPTASDAFR